MNTYTVPESVRSFILQYVDSVELLQVLLLLHRKPEKAWTLEEVEHEIRSSQSAIQKRLNDLYSRKVLQKEEGDSLHRFKPYSAEIAAEISAVADFNQTHGSRVIELIYSRQNETLMNFANAFKVKKDK